MSKMPLDYLFGIFESEDIEKFDRDQTLAQWTFESAETGKKL